VRWLDAGRVEDGRTRRAQDHRGVGLTNDEDDGSTSESVTGTRERGAVAVEAVIPSDATVAIWRGVIMAARRWGPCEVRGRLRVQRTIAEHADYRLGRGSGKQDHQDDSDDSLEVRALHSCRNGKRRSRQQQLEVPWFGL
jgi:hypothetical protein